LHNFGTAYSTNADPSSLWLISIEASDLFTAIPSRILNDPSSPGLVPEILIIEMISDWARKCESASDP